MTETLASHIEYFASFAHTAPLLFFFFIFLFMTIESSFIPFPSEVVMIPAGFLIWRYPLTPSHALDVVIVIAVGLSGSMAGAYINYFLSKWLGRPVLHTLLKKYGKFILMSEQSLDRAEEIFREYGEVVTFISRLLPAIRQLISIPAGIARMPLGEFTLFTALGAGVWTAILAAVGYAIGRSTADIGYLELCTRGKAAVSAHLPLVIGVALALAAGYILVSKLVMRGDRR